jgi:hypothetical protein
VDFLQGEGAKLGIVGQAVAAFVRYFWPISTRVVVVVLSLGYVVVSVLGFTGAGETVALLAPGVIRFYQIPPIAPATLPREPATAPK